MRRCTQSNEDMLYTLALFIFGPVVSPSPYLFFAHILKANPLQHFVERYDWRGYSDEERVVKYKPEGYRLEEMVSLISKTTLPESLALGLTTGILSRVLSIMENGERSRLGSLRAAD